MFIIFALLCAVPLHLGYSQKGNNSKSPVHVTAETAQKHLMKYVAPEIPGDLILNHPAIVKLRAVIGKDGIISSAKVVEGHVLLYAAALDAVQQWKYKPFVVQGYGTEIETAISVIFERRPSTREGLKSPPN